MSVELIAFDKNRNIYYEGICDFFINQFSSMLVVEPQNKIYKSICAPFTWNYVYKKNILFVFDEQSSLHFVMAFPNELNCRAVQNRLPQNQINQQEDALIRSRFLIPIFNKIKENPLTNQNFIQIIATWVLQFDHEEKSVLMKLMKDHNVYDIVFTEIHVYTDPEQDVQHLALFHEAQTLLLGINEPPKRQRKSSTNSTILQKTIPESMFELHKNSKGENGKKLVVFTSPTKDSCYCYFWKKGKIFRCYSCKDKKKYVTARLCENKDGQRYLELNGNEHACKQRNYQAVMDEANKRHPPISFVAEC
uniref:Uncharacterized protein n=2 Tax=Panagrolaimus sp. PS1159 TaxID=55785 RepID=A0AC35GG54_9BILA